MVIEVDGEIHLDQEQQQKDKEKENDIRNLGLTIIRFSNEEVLFDIESVLSRIRAKIDEIKYKQFPLSGGRG